MPKWNERMQLLKKTITVIVLLYMIVQVIVQIYEINMFFLMAQIKDIDLQSEFIRCNCCGFEEAQRKLIENCLIWKFQTLGLVSYPHTLLTCVLK